MFYFGGMTLGYLTPPAPKGGRKDGETVAETRQAEEPSLTAEQILTGRGLLARANWFGLQG